MPVITITEAAKLVGRGRATLYRDIEKGLLTRHVSTSGGPGIDTEELKRVYGKRPAPEPARNKTQISVLEEQLRSHEHRIELLQRIVELEKKTRQLSEAGLRGQMAVKDELIAELRSRLALLESAHAGDRQGARLQIVPAPVRRADQG